MGAQSIRPPSLLTRAELAWELSIAESTVDDFVRRGILPSPIRFSPGCVRWSWSSVEAVIASLERSGNSDPAEDPFMAGARNATKEAREGNGRAA